MRTQYSKLIKVANKSGSGAAQRQQWLLDSFAFLRPNIVQLRGQRGSKVSYKN
ncbi:hypothetical protein DPMN_071803 [Dreissena polymorpha]|uniref:Uncharacterized protein n=1 Tax=Dreissena polymorpha TaxID=45954 RepID=A0A9D3Z8F0_DREPO|nr:hypothetical protein DPMN_071803 [Dreissena polymorpha]